MDGMFIAFIMYSQIVVVTVCFFVLEGLYKQSWRNQILILLIAGISALIGRSYSHLDLLILFVLLFIFAYKLLPEKSQMQLILSIMISAILEAIISLIASWVLGIYLNMNAGISKSLLSLALVLFIGVFCVGTATLLRERLYPYLIREKKVNSVALFLMFIVFSYQTISMIQTYAENEYLFLMFLLFYCLVAGLVISVLRFLLKNSRLEAEAKTNKIISDLQASYVDEVKKQYQEMRKFRHDYTNLLSTVNYYLEHDEIEELKHFFAKDMLETSALLKENNLILDALQNIESLGIRSIFYTKLLLAQQRNIPMQVEIKEAIPDIKKVGTVSLVRLFGIFLDNAIEELDALKDGSLTIVVFKDQDEVTYVVQNTAREEIEPLQQLKKEGFSTRGENRGLGLANVEEILQNEPDLLLETSFAENTFIQKLTILREVKENDANLYL